MSASSNPSGSPRAERKADTIARDLLEQIVRGDIPVGGLLPKENELAATYGSARSVVREAIKLLEVHRLVKPTRRLGTVALDPLASPSADVVRAMLQQGGHIDLDVFAGWLEIRAVLDVQMSMLACARRSAADLDALAERLAALTAAARDPQAFSRESLDFSLVLARATHNPLYLVLAQWHASVVVDLEHVFLTIRTAGVPHVAGIGLLVECIRKKDAVQAKELVETFHAWASPRLLAAARLANGEHPTPAKKRRSKP